MRPSSHVPPKSRDKAVAWLKGRQNICRPFVLRDAVPSDSLRGMNTAPSRQQPPGVAQAADRLAELEQLVGALVANFEVLHAEHNVASRKIAGLELERVARGRAA